MYCTVIHTRPSFKRMIPTNENGVSLGDDTGELQEYGCVSISKEFVSGVLKNHTFSVYCPPPENVQESVKRRV